MKSVEQPYTFISLLKSKLSYDNLLFQRFEKMKDLVLGKKYSLSVVITGNALSKKLNKEYRNIDKPTDILSFPLGKNEGEIFINLAYSKKKAKEFDREFPNFLEFLFIHGLVHLKGHDHGEKMEALEKKYRKVFKI